MKLDITQFLNKNEDECLEYKEGFNPEDIASTIASFSTNKGGYILLGVKDDGSPVGYRCIKKDIEAKIYDLAKNTIGGRASIQIDFEDYREGSFIVIIKVYEGDKKPYGWKGVYYNRIGSSDEKLNSDQITEITLKSKNLHYDCLVAELFHRKANINDLDEKKVSDYISYVNNGKRNKKLNFPSTKTFLQNFNLICNENIVRNAAILLFGKNPQEFFPSTRVQFLIYSGENVDDSKLKKRILFEGDLISQLNNVFDLIKINTENKIVLEGLKRIEISQYPLNAIREAVINSVAHRDYSISNADIIIRLFDTKLEITNPGGLMNGIDIEELKKGGYHSVRRNPTICALFDNLGYMEQSGNGIKSMILAMRKYGLPEPRIQADNSYFKIEFYGQNINNPGERPLIGLATDFTSLLTDLEKKGLEIIKNYPETSFTIKDYLLKTGIKSRITVARHLGKLEKMGLIKGTKIGREIIYKKIATLS